MQAGDFRKRSMDSGASPAASPQKRPAASPRQPSAARSAASPRQPSSAAAPRKSQAPPPIKTPPVPPVKRPAESGLSAYEEARLVQPHLTDLLFFLTEITKKVSLGPASRRSSNLHLRSCRWSNLLNVLLCSSLLNMSDATGQANIKRNEARLRELNLHTLAADIAPAPTPAAARGISNKRQKKEKPAPGPRRSTRASGLDEEGARFLGGVLWESRGNIEVAAAVAPRAGVPVAQKAAEPAAAVRRPAGAPLCFSVFERDAAEPG